MIKYTCVSMFVCVCPCLVCDTVCIGHPRHSRCVCVCVRIRLKNQPVRHASSYTEIIQIVTYLKRLAV